jgi:hypothetical protein
LVGDRNAYNRAQRHIKLLPSRIQGYARSNPAEGNAFVARFNELNKKLVARVNNKESEAVASAPATPSAADAPAVGSTTSTTHTADGKTITTTTTTTRTPDGRLKTTKTTKTTRTISMKVSAPAPASTPSAAAASAPPSSDVRAVAGAVEEAASRDSFVKSIERDLDQLATLDRNMKNGEAGVWARAQSRVRLSASRIESIRSKYPNKHTELAARLSSLTTSMKAKAATKRAATPLPSPNASPKASPLPQRVATLPYHDRRPFEIVTGVCSCE